MIYAYGDDGADEQRQRVVSVAIIAGREAGGKKLKPNGKCGAVIYLFTLRIAKATGEIMQTLPTNKTRLYFGT